jgi:hypothetical protein
MPGILVAVHLHAAAGFALLHDRAAIDEQAGEVDGFVERTTAVVAQVEHDAVDLVAAQLGQQLGDVARRRRVVAVVAATALRSPGRSRAA